MTMNAMCACIDATLDKCMQLAKMYVQSLINRLNARFSDLALFNTVKILSPCHYVEDSLIREPHAKIWLEKLSEHVQPNGNAECNALWANYVDVCKKELYAFMDALRLNCIGFTMKEAWLYFCIKVKWHFSFPNIMKLW